MTTLAPLFRLSWKNIWRNKTRSGVVITAVILGTMAGVFMSAFMFGLSMQMIRSELEHFVSHILIQDNRFIEESMPEFVIAGADSLLQSIHTHPEVTASSARIRIDGLASSSASSFGVTIRGIHPETEQQVTRIHERLTEGDYLQPGRRNAILIGNKLAERLNLGLRSKVVLNFQEVDGDITAAAFRVSGIYRSPNSGYDERNVFVRYEDMARLIGDDSAVHEIAILVENFKNAAQVADDLKLPEGIQARSWMERSPSLAYTDAMVGTILYIVMGIILIALTFGIINTMLMAVLERQQELGMLMAIGLEKTRIFMMILLETFFMSVVGAPFGVLMAWLGILLLQDTGINLGMFAEGFESYGIGTIIYPELNPGYYLNIGILIFITALLAALYPSYRALKLKPVEAIRKL